MSVARVTKAVTSLIFSPRNVSTLSANGQPALAFYIWDEDEQAYMPFALNVLTFRGEKISDVVAFVVRATDIPATQSYGRWVDEPMDQDRLYASFERFGLPERLDEEALNAG